MILQVIILVLLAVTAAAGEQCKYAKFSPKHSFCKPRNPKCKIFDTGLNATDKLSLVKLHNKYRSKIAQGKEKRAGGMPPAADMLEIVWDDELAAIAQKYSEQCLYEHDCDKCKRVDRFVVGQNIYRIAISLGEIKKEVAIENGVKMWYDEVEVFDKKLTAKYGSAPKSKKWGHLTQMIWAESWQMGCGIVQYKDKRNWKTLMLFCNYGPAGNYIEEPVYKAGKACSACPRGSSCSKSYPGLCKVKNTTYRDRTPLRNAIRI